MAATRHAPASQFRTATSRTIDHGRVHVRYGRDRSIDEVRCRRRVPTKTLPGATSRRPAFGSWRPGLPAAPPARPARSAKGSEEEGPRGGNVAARRTPAATPAAQGAALRGLRCPLPSLLYIGPAACCVGPALFCFPAASCLPTPAPARPGLAIMGWGELRTRRLRELIAAEAGKSKGSAWERIATAMNGVAKRGDNPNKFTVMMCQKKWARMVRCLHTTRRSHATPPRRHLGWATSEALDDGPGPRSAAGNMPGSAALFAPPHRGHLH